MPQEVYKTLSATFFYKRFKNQPLWYLCDTWTRKRENMQDKELSQTERVKAWQSLMAIKKILNERGNWDSELHRPIINSTWIA